jgi:hypothetical protein
LIRELLAGNSTRSDRHERGRWPGGRVAH